MAFITKTVDLDSIIASEPQTIWYSALTCWWTHRRTDLCQHPQSGIPTDPRGAPLLMLQPASHVKDFFRRVRLSARDGVYGKHGLDAFIAAHAANCQVGIDDPRPTSLQTWREYNLLIDSQSVVEAPKQVLRNADLSDPLVEKTVTHEPHLRILERDGDDGLDEVDGDGEEEA